MFWVLIQNLCKIIKNDIQRHKIYKKFAAASYHLQDNHVMTTMTKYIVNRIFMYVLCLCMSVFIYLFFSNSFNVSIQHLFIIIQKSHYSEVLVWIWLVKFFFKK